MNADTEKGFIDEVEIEETAEEEKADPGTKMTESKYKTEDDSKEEKEVMKDAGCSKRPTEQ